MKKLFLILTVIFLSVSCADNSKKEPSMKPETTTIKGDLGDYYEVIDKEYAIKKVSIFYVINIEVKKLNDELPFDPDQFLPFGYFDSSKPVRAGFGIEILDKDGSPIEIKQASTGGTAGVYSTDDVKNLIGLKKGETGIIRWAIDEKSLGDIALFRITSAVEGSSGKNFKSNKVSYTNDSDSSDWDKILDNYEVYVDKYIQLAKKAQKGDVSAISEYAQCLEKAEELQEQLEKADSNLSTKQLNRFNKIIAKLAAAASEISIDIDIDDEKDDDDF